MAELGRLNDLAVASVANLNGVALTSLASVYGLTPPASGDPYTKLLLHMDGTGTTFTDASSSSRSSSWVEGGGLGGGQTATGAKESFGNCSLFVVYSAESSYLDITDLSSMAPGTGDFVIDGWVKADVINAISLFLASYGTSLLSVYRSSSSNVRVRYGGTTAYISLASPFIADTWQHFALVRSSGTLRFFVDGVQKGTDMAYSADISAWTAFNVGPAISAPLLDGNVRLDEFRVSIGTDRGWASGFTPPTAPYSA